MYILDANIISALLQRDNKVSERLRTALISNKRIVLSPVAYYEVKRGLLKKPEAVRQSAHLEEIANTWFWDDFQKSDWDTAASIWASEGLKGRTPTDVDLFIAIEARRLDAVLVTDNVKHFVNLGVKIENWKR